MDVPRISKPWDSPGFPVEKIDLIEYAAQ
jgi:hypothetical protein